ncbi:MULTISPECIES: phosphatase PAP2 family protein [unclassified Microbacterium]|uniref:phosphatase PAP2 family protein n=1 Tax=unclassified Microbacterium TaxID=2609290 RepID=UPI00214BF749|nr:MULTISPECIES: phosphatase PAP2 family protein [unclassified Microbacterium]MCR2783835.1 phosphatase PAP2 family protein [Microbacterium sp. zg.B96]MDL5351373.1 phosphatase PAP2 family protein [Microbacterium sp. zg-YB36]WIM15317.1 phosphatase PAP2 family protein [Microbacterium sp. zg-B96]
MDPLRRPVAGLLVPGLVLIAFACGLGGWILLRGTTPFIVDDWWNLTLLQWTVEPVTLFSYAMNWLGGGVVGVFVVPIGGALVLVLLRRYIGALFFIAASVFSAAGVQVLKHLFGRARPEEIIVISDYGSFPSGHTANAATIAVVAVVLFPRVWVAVAGAVWVALMAFSRTYLHAHWLSDTLGGAFVGAGAALVVAAAFAVQLRAEQNRVSRRVASLPA